MTHHADVTGNNGRAGVSEIVSLLQAHATGDATALDHLMPLVYDDLRRIAHRRLRGERRMHTLDTTAIVHEAYLRLVSSADQTWKDRAHFFAIASRVIRNVLTDYARQRGALKRGGSVIRVPLREDMVGDPDTADRDVDLLALDEALSALALHDPRLEQVVECRFFGGLSVLETAEALGTSVRTVERDWTRARAYLYRELADEVSGNGEA